MWNAVALTHIASLVNHTFMELRSCSTHLSEGSSLVSAPSAADRCARNGLCACQYARAYVCVCVSPNRCCADSFRRFLLPSALLSFFPSPPRSPTLSFLPCLPADVSPPPPPPLLHIYGLHESQWGGGTAVRPAVKPAFLSPLCRVFLNGVRALSASSLSSSPPYTRPKQGWGRSRAADLSAKESLQNVSGSSRSLFLTRAPEGTSGNDHKEREPVQPSVLRWISSHRHFRGKGKTNFL